MGSEIIAVDFDGTLAYYDEWRGPTVLGRPITPMLTRVLRWLSEGKEVHILTARVFPGNEGADEARAAIQAWCKKWIGRELPVTHEKNPDMKEIWDDRAVAVEANTGRIKNRTNAVAAAWLAVEVDNLLSEDGTLMEEAAILALMAIWKELLAGRTVKLVSSRSNNLHARQTINRWSQLNFKRLLPIVPSSKGSGKPPVKLTPAKGKKKPTPKAKSLFKTLVAATAAGALFDKLSGQPRPDSVSITDQGLRSQQLPTPPDIVAPSMPDEDPETAAVRQAVRSMMDEVRTAAAIGDKRIVEMTYDGHRRIVEPHAYGTSRRGNPVVRAYQTQGGHVTPGHDWCFFLEGKMQDVQDTGRRFQNPRPLYRRGDKHMTQIFSQV